MATKRKSISIKANEETSKPVAKEVTEVVENTPPEPVVEKKKPAPKPKKVFEQTDRILCHSVTQGALYVDSPKTKQMYFFSEYGDETEIEYRDLIGLVSERSSYVYHPYFLIDDPDFVAEFPQLERFYTEHYEISELNEILKLPVEIMLSKLKKLPAGAAENVKILASSQVSDGTLDSVRKIKALNEFFDIDLNLIAELADR